MVLVLLRRPLLWRVSAPPRPSRRSCLRRPRPGSRAASLDPLVTYGRTPEAHRQSRQNSGGPAAFGVDEWRQGQTGERQRGRRGQYVHALLACPALPIPAWLRAFNGQGPEFVLGHVSPLIASMAGSSPPMGGERVGRLPDLSDARTRSEERRVG